MASTDRPALLGIERSVTGRRGRQRGDDTGNDNLALAIAQKHGLPDLVGRLLAARGIATDEVPLYLEPTLRDLLPNPSRFLDMDKAVARLVAAIGANEKIVVWGDYDVDGATSTALLQRYFASIGHPVGRYIPDRIREGYGPNSPALLKLREEGAAVVVTVDCGITAHEPLAAAEAAGLDVIVLDHHQSEPQLPPAHAIVNPNRLDEEPGFGQLAAVGVTFLVLVGLNRALREAGHFATRREPDLLELLDLVALGTVCDVVPLTGLNRALVSQGLRIAARRGNVGMAALADIARMETAPGTFHLGFMIGPRLNAGGRVGEADLGARILSTGDPGEANRIALHLDALNDERRAIEQQVLDRAMAAIGEEPPSAPLTFVAEAGWHPGVIGIVASRLVERYGRPACVVALADGIGKGSGRSMPGLDLGAAVIAARQSGLLVNGGGHAMAAGFTVAEENLPAQQSFLGERLLQMNAGNIDVARTLGIDGPLAAGAVDLALAERIAALGPFGSGNPEPRFALSGVRILRADAMGKDHLRCFVAGSDGKQVRAVAFRVGGTPLGELLASRGGGMPVHLAGHLRAETWQGRTSVRFFIEDAAPA
ncbi:MAG: single-stranded-DNA-specific exonuclease RecJ [Dongiaceae bacterium]